MCAICLLNTTQSSRPALSSTLSQKSWLAHIRSEETGEPGLGINIQTQNHMVGYRKRRAKNYEPTDSIWSILQNTRVFCTDCTAGCRHQREPRRPFQKLNFSEGGCNYFKMHHWTFLLLLYKTIHSFPEDLIYKSDPDLYLQLYHITLTLLIGEYQIFFTLTHILIMGIILKALIFGKNVYIRF